MIFIMKKIDEQYLFYEDDRHIFSVELQHDNKLLSVILKNMYDDEIFGAYQIKKWYSSIKPEIMNAFTLYEHEEKLGEIHKRRGCFEIVYHDVFYRLYSGSHIAKRTAICFDRKEQIAEFVIEEESSVKFKNSSLGVLFCLLMILMKECLPQEKFSKAVFLHHYKGKYNDDDRVAV